MRLETLKRKIDEIAVRRMLRDSKDHFDARNPKRLEWRHCNECSTLYNRHEEPYKSAGAGKKFCSSTCEERSALLHQTIHSTQVVANKRRERTREKQVDSRALKRLRTLAKEFGTRLFSYTDAAISLKVNRTNVMARIKDMASLGWLTRHGSAKAGVEAMFSVTTDTLEWALGGNRCQE